jgi:hypothetical protein
MTEQVNQDPANWRERIGGCFGTTDLIWGSHALDEVRCKQLFKDAIDAGATMADIVQAAKQYLLSKGADADHMQAQVAAIRNLRVSPPSETICGEGKAIIAAICDNIREIGLAIISLLPQPTSDVTK